MSTYFRVKMIIYVRKKNYVIVIAACEKNELNDRGCAQFLAYIFSCQKKVRVCGAFLYCALCCVLHADSLELYRLYLT